LKRIQSRGGIEKKIRGVGGKKEEEN